VRPPREPKDMKDPAGSSRRPADGANSTNQGAIRQR
jgi:hypothetical protein